MRQIRKPETHDRTPAINANQAGHVGRAAARLTTLEPPDFFDQLERYPRLARSRRAEVRAGHDAFVAIAELCIGLGPRIGEPEFVAEAKRQAQAMGVRKSDPIAAILRRGMRYEEEWMGLPDDAMRQARSAALRRFSQHDAALRWVLERGWPVDGIRRRLRSGKGGIRRWERSYRARHPARARPAAARPVHSPVDIEELADQLLEALSDRLSTNFPIDADLGALFYVQFDVGPTGGRQLLGARRIGMLPRFMGKEGRRRLRLELRRLVKKPPVRPAE